MQDDSEGEDFEPGEVDDEDEEIEDGDGNVQFIINKKNTRGLKTQEYLEKNSYGLVADESRGVKRKHEDEEGDDDAAAQ